MSWKTEMIQELEAEISRLGLRLRAICQSIDRKQELLAKIRGGMDDKAKGDCKIAEC